MCTTVIKFDRLHFFLLTCFFTTCISSHAMRLTQIWICMALRLSPRKYFRWKFCFRRLKNLWEASHKLFKWIKQHLQVKRFWGESDNAVRIQIHVAIITYCLIAIIAHDLKIGRPVFEVMRILGKSALTMDNIQSLLKPLKEDVKPNDRQLYFDFD